MELHRAKLLVMALAALTLLLITLTALFKISFFFIAGMLSYIAMVVVWFLFNRCPHCKKFLGRDTGVRCPHCGKRL